VFGCAGFEPERNATAGLRDDIPETGPGLDLGAVSERDQLVLRPSAPEDGVRGERSPERHRAGDAEPGTEAQVRLRGHRCSLGDIQRPEDALDGLDSDGLAVQRDARALLAPAANRDGDASRQREAATPGPRPQRVLVGVGTEEGRDVSRDERARDRRAVTHRPCIGGERLPTVGLRWPSSY